MDKEQYVCTGCALLCDDICVEVEGTELTKVHTACRKGVAFMKGSKDTLECRVHGKVSDVETAIKEAAHILKNAKSPLIFGHANSSSEAQQRIIDLARRTNGVIDDVSSFGHGPLVQALFDERLKTCTLDDVRHKADVIVFWGTDPANSHPRHMSRYSYFPRGKERQRGWEEDRTAICIDVRRSDTAAVCKKNGFYQIPVKGDTEFMDALVSALSGKVPKTSYGFDTKRLIELANILKKAKFGVIFAGLGMVYSLEENETLFRLMDKLNSVSNFHLIPMIGHYNMRGFNKKLFSDTGHIDRVRFNGQELSHGPECSVLEVLRQRTVDAALIIGADPFSSFPRSIARYLGEIPLVVIDHDRTLTYEKATVSLPCALTGVEAGGTAIRMDGVEVRLKQIVETELLSDEEIVKRIGEAL